MRASRCLTPTATLEEAWLVTSKGWLIERASGELAVLQGGQ